MPEPVVTLHLWGVPSRRVPAALSRMALDRPAVRRTPGLTFGKLLGTGDGRTFTVRDADPHRWGLLAVWRDRAAADEFDATGVPRRWRRIADEQWRADLRPLASRGRWSGREPFPITTPAPRHRGPVAALTRARLTARKAATFWRAVPPVSADLHASPGLRYAVGIGEAPVGLQGTFSVWADGGALTDFAYGRAAHRQAIRQTAEQGWYAEELFARFALERTTGTVDGRDPGA